MSEPRITSEQLVTLEHRELQELLSKFNQQAFEEVETMAQNQGFGYGRIFEPEVAQRIATLVGGSIDRRTPMPVSTHDERYQYGLVPGSREAVLLGKLQDATWGKREHPANGDTDPKIFEQPPRRAEGVWHIDAEYLHPSELGFVTTIRGQAVVKAAVRGDDGVVRVVPVLASPGVVMAFRDDTWHSFSAPLVDEDSSPQSRLIAATGFTWDAGVGRAEADFGGELIDEQQLAALEANQHPDLIKI